MIRVALLLLTAAPVAAQTMDPAMPGMGAPAPAATVAPAPPDQPAAMDPAMPGMTHDHGGMAAMAGMDGYGMAAALGSYPMTREASGTSWQPDASTHEGLHLSAGDWAIMLHGYLDGVYTSQSGPRGGDKGFVAGHIMAMASRDVSDRDHVQFRLAVAPDPAMGPRGYPLLLATGETADGINPLVDRQHPHDLFAEVSASISHRLSDTVGVFAYGGLPGEPAFGPPVYIHRQSIMDDPEAPITHHWLDSMHISEGVVTLGVVAGPIKVEASRFRGREPDQHRWDIEQPNLDSTAVRVSWNPARTLSLQASWAHQVSAEQLNPDQNIDRWSASGIYTRPVGKDGFWATTAAWGRRTIVTAGVRDTPSDAFLLESAIRFDGRWTIFGRAERVENNELLAGSNGQAGPSFTVGKVSAGAIRDFRVARHLLFGLGTVVSHSLTPAGLDRYYGGDQTSALGFVRLKIG